MDSSGDAPTTILKADNNHVHLHLTVGRHSIFFIAILTLQMIIPDAATQALAESNYIHCGKKALQLAM